jgi:hypothetical protein
MPTTLSALFTLAQLPLGGDRPAIPPLPSPPMIPHALFEEPARLVAVLALGALVCAWLVVSGRAAKTRWVRLGAPLLVVLALAVWGTARLVKTEREVLIEQTREFIDLAAAADTPGLQQLLASDVTFRLLGGESVFTREQVLALVRKYPGDAYPINWHASDQHQAVVSAHGYATTQAHVRAKSKEGLGYDLPVGSWWKLEWRRDGADWEVSRIECLQIDGVPSGAGISP